MIEYHTDPYNNAILKLDTCNKHLWLWCSVQKIWLQLYIKCPTRSFLEFLNFPKITETKVFLEVI